MGNKSSSKGGAVCGGLIVGLVIGIVVGAFVLPGLGIIPGSGGGSTTNYTLKIIRYENSVNEKLGWKPAINGTVEGDTLPKNVTLTLPAGSVVLLIVEKGDVNFWQGLNASLVYAINSTTFSITLTGNLEIQPHWL